MRRVLILVLLLAGMQLILPLGRAVPASGAVLTLGFLILAADAVGGLVSRVGLPKLLGYLIAGLIFGPSALGTVTAGAVYNLKPVSEIAVALIAFLAGAELKWEDIKSDGKRYAGIVAVEMPLNFVVLVAGVFLLQSQIPVLDNAPPVTVLVFGMLVAAVGMAHSPAATLGLIAETGARGPLTRNTLGLVLLSDLILVVLFTLVVALCRLLLPPTGAAQGLSFGFVVWEIVGALLVGTVIGVLVALYLRFIRRELLLFGFMIAVFGAEVAKLAHVETLLTLLTAGFISENFTREGSESLKHAVERAAAPVFVVFFALSGASINVADVLTVAGVVVPLVVLRIGSIWFGTTMAARASGLPPDVARRAWMGLVAQMGVAIGLASVAAEVYPDLGPTVRTVALAVIAMNELMGPAFFKRALTLAGEIRRPAT